jgi:16S rRNA G1207 methylase RsmC
MAVDGLREDDAGIALLARAVADADPAGVLLVHCGDLPGLRASAGAAATRLVLDVRELADCRSRAVPATVPPRPPGRFDHAVVWPRAHLGKDFTQQCLALAASSLHQGGSLWCSARKHKGAESHADFIEAVLGNVEVVRRDGGYRLLHATRGESIDLELATAAMERTYEIADPALGELRLRASPGVFSRKGLDAGTRGLIERAAALAIEPSRVLDLCAGVGPLALWAATRWGHARVLAVESNFVAVEHARFNAERAGVGARVDVQLGAGLPASAPDLRGAIDLALCNPPTHAPEQELDALLGGLAGCMRAGAPALLVVNRPGRATEALARAGATVERTAIAGYTILSARW